MHLTIVFGIDCQNNQVDRLHNQVNPNQQELHKNIHLKELMQ